MPYSSRLHPCCVRLPTRFFSNKVQSIAPSSKSATTNAQQDASQAFLSRPGVATGTSLAADWEVTGLGMLKTAGTGHLIFLQSRRKSLQAKGRTAGRPCAPTLLNHDPERPSASRAVILAGGRGTRLHPFTITLPKPLVPIGDQPILEIVIGQLIAHGFSHVTLAVNHQAEIIRAYFGDGGRWNIKIDYSMEKKPLSTMAPLRLIPDLPDNFLVMNGDVLTDLAFDRFLDEHSRGKQLFTISAARREQTIDYGVLQMAADGYLTDFAGKAQDVLLREHGHLLRQQKCSRSDSRRRSVRFRPADARK